MFRVLFFGTPAFAVATLEALLASRHQVVGVVTQPDRPRGRGHALSASPVKAVAEAQGVPVWQPQRLKDDAFLDLVRSLDVDIGVVAAYGKILPEVLLQIPRLGILNVHASLLPQYRGASPVHRAVIAGDTETGVTIMRVVKELDAGPMLAQAVRPIDPEETSVEVEAGLARLGATLLVGTLNEMSTGPVPEVAQDDRVATFAPRLTKEEGVIDWTLPAGTIHNRVRGLQPWPMAFTFLSKERVLLHKTRVGAPASTESTSCGPGVIIPSDPDVLRVICGQQTVLNVLTLQFEGRRPMSAREVHAGRRIAPGASFDAGPAP